MKIKQLLVLGAVLLTSVTATAEIINGVRQRPNVAKAEAFQIDSEYYLFNTEARLFFLGANDWNTRASIGTKGYRVKIVQSDFAPEGCYEFTDSVETKKEWLCMFSTADGGAIWVDNSGETYRFWAFTENNGKYRISNPDLATVAETTDGKFLGWNGTDDTRLYFVDPATEGVGIDWVFVTEETYKAWVEAWGAMEAQFNAAAELLTYLKAAKEQKIDVSAEEQVYLNEAATVEEIEAAIAAVQKKINDAQAGNATVDNPSDMTGSLMNPNFDNASYAGWKGTAPNMAGDGNHANADVAEHFNKTFDTYQQLSNMPAGVYMLENTGFLRGWLDDYKNHTNYTAYLYTIADNDTMQVAMANPWEALNDVPMAGDTGFGTTAYEESDVIDGITYYIPNDPSAARLYFEKGYYKNKVLFAIESDSVKLGVKKGVNRTNEWATFDNFKLTYYGKAAEAYQYFIENAVTKKEYEEVNVSEQYLKAYETAFKATATNKAEAKAALAAINAAADSVEANIKMWSALNEKYKAAQQLSIDNNQLATAGELSDYLTDVEDQSGIQDDPDVKEGDLDLNNSQLQAMIDRLTELMAAVDKEAKENLKPGDDVTDYISNPGFEDGSNGWTVVSKGGGNVQIGGNSDNHCYEAWHSTDFDVYQEIKDLPLGVYEVSVNGYVRYLDGDDAITKASDAPENVPIYVYMNDSKTNLVSWLSYPKPEEFYKYDKEAGTGVEGAAYRTDGSGNAYPDNMIAASAAFADGGYAQTAKCLVAESGTVTRIGVKGTPEAIFWPIFDNFKLTYLGYAIDVVKPLLEEKIAEARNIENEMTTKSAKAALTSALSDATTAVEGTEGLAMFRATAKLNKAINDAMEGTTLCTALLAEAEALATYASVSESTLAEEAIALASNIIAGLEESAYDEADLQAQSIMIKEMKLKMQLPVDYAETSAKGKDVTAFIQTPSFQETKDGVEVNSINGWQGTSGYNFGNDDTQKGALALEFYEKKFDMYQDLAGVGSVVLPKGYYCLQVNAFERVNEASPAYLYAVAGKDTLDVVELMKHDKGYVADEGESAPGDMVSSVALFENGRYLNELKFNFQADTLRIGIMHKESNGADWIIMDNFKLFFYGTDNTGVETVVNLGKPVQVQYFTIDGRQVSAARKGLVIRKTIMDNGAVIVRKIQK